MILATDVYYASDSTLAACVAFSDWEAVEPVDTFTLTLPASDPYIPGAFYKRELPPLMAVLEQPLSTFTHLEAVVVDGFVHLDNAGAPGLGWYLWEALGKTIPVIGVAKRPFYQNTSNVIAVHRGGSTNPLQVTSIGVPLESAAQFIQQMAGPFRMPTMLKLVDQMSKGREGD